MCGISGYVGFDLNTNDFKDASQLQNHRGPDFNGIYEYKNSDYRILLGHNRLAIIDIDERSNQPFVDSNNKFIIVFNGEVYNFKFLLKKYIKPKNIPIRTSSDTEVVMLLIKHYGISIISEFKGMFSFAIFDKISNKLFIVRDRMGVKPLHFHFLRNQLFFSSEIKFIKKFTDNELNINSLNSFLQLGYTPRNQSIYQKINKVSPGSYIEYDLITNKFKSVKYWSPINSEFKYGEMSYTEYRKNIKELLYKSVEYRLISDVPVGVFLSGGVDSSLVTAMAKKIIPGDLKTFTIGFEDSKFNEATYAKEIANYIGTNHYEKILSRNDIISVIDKLPRMYDEPFGDSSAIPTFLVSKLAAENGVKVVLSADGGDEFFFGYSKYTRYLQLIKYYKLFSKIFAHVIK